MIEVLSSFNCTSNTFFLSVDIMDSYLEFSEKTFETKDIHLIGVTSMLIASKMEEIIPFKVSTVIEKMAHGRMKTKEIVETEEQILKAIDFKLFDKPSLYVFVEILTVILDLHNKVFYKDMMNVIGYLSKMIVHDYSILTTFSIKYLAASCLFISFKIMEQVFKDFKSKVYIEKIKSKLKLNEQIFFTVSEATLNLAKNFEKNFAFAKNLSKFNSFTLESSSSN